MDKRKLLIGACYLLLLHCSLLSHAAEDEYYNDMKTVLTGNTVEGKISKQGTNYKMYFHPSGRLVRLDNKDNHVKGRWTINKKNELCLNFDSEECLTIKKRTDERFDLYSQNGDLKLTIDKVTLGNPDKLKP